MSPPVTFEISAFFKDMCFCDITVSLYSIKGLVFIMETEFFLCEAGTVV